MSRAPSYMVAVLFGTFTLAQAQPDLKRGDRPVFRSARVLADDCRKFLVIFPDGKPLSEGTSYKVTTDQMVGAASCSAYIAGAEDRELEGPRFGSHYHPVPAEVDYIKPLIDTFLKYVGDHPEEQDFAASTILQRAEKMVLEAQRPH
jgi:hypothetical protein